MIGLIAVPSILFFPLMQITENFDLARLVFSFLSFAILYEFLDSTFILKKAAESMLEMDNELSRNNEIHEDYLLNVFSQYAHLKRIVHSTPDAIYEKYRPILNKGWESRLKEFY